MYSFVLDICLFLIWPSQKICVGGDKKKLEQIVWSFIMNLILTSTIQQIKISHTNHEYFFFQTATIEFMVSTFGYHTNSSFIHMVL